MMYEPTRLMALVILGEKMKETVRVECILNKTADSTKQHDANHFTFATVFFVVLSNCILRLQIRGKNVLIEAHVFLITSVMIHCRRLSCISITHIVVVFL